MLSAYRHTCDISLFRRELPIFCLFFRKSPYENFQNFLFILYISLFGISDLPTKIQEFPSLFNHSPYLEKKISLFVFWNVSHVCLSWTDSIWTLAEKRRSFKGRGMGKKKESKGKQQKGFTSKRSSRTESLDDPAGSSVISLDDDSPSGELAPVLSRSSSGGDLRLGDSSVPSQRSYGTTGSKADSGSLTTHRSTPSRSHPGDLDGKYGVQAPAFMATPFGPNPPPGDPTLSTLSQDRSSRSGSKYPVDRPSSDRSDRSTRKGSIGDRSHRSPSTGTTGHRSHRSPGTG